MEFISYTLENITGALNNPELSGTRILAVLFMVTILAIYEFIVYRVVSHRAFYNKSFNICIAVLPFFIATIVMCLQVDIVITLGTIGALAIIRFRTAVKDPVDMLYLLWSVHTGIICGCQLYEVSIFTSIIVTIVLIILEHSSFGKKPYVVVCRCKNEEQDMLLSVIKDSTKAFKVKSRNYTSSGLDLVIEFSTKDIEMVAQKIKECAIEKFSIIEYDNEDVV